MTEVDQILRPEPRRDRFGRYLINGKAWTRCTTYIKAIDDRHNLEKWQQRMVAAGLAQRDDLLAQAAANIGDKKKLDEICNAAIEAAKGSSGANTGSALHSFTEKVDLGIEVHIPAPWDKDVAAYQQTLADNGVRIDRKFVEGIVLNETLSVAGTFDRLVTIDGWDLPVIADLKTGSNLSYTWSSIATQLAIYANATHLYDVAKDKCLPMPDVDKQRALVIHLPAGEATCTLHVVDIAAGWYAAEQLCAGVREWRALKNLSKPFTREAGETRAAFLRRRVEQLREHPDALQALAASWPIGVATFKQSDAHSAEELERIALAIDAVRSKFSVPFDDTDRQHPTDNSISDQQETAA